MMDLTAEQIQLATMIDAHVNKYPESQLGDEHLLRSTFDYMDAFKRIMDSSTSVQMEYLCQQYDGFYRFAKLLESLAQGIADGDIEVPKDH
ncbi:MAG: arylsulfatase regulator [Gammaproteobacteria bacterium]|nr:arylsulfatase regulator [Gammaproteobacteria bacterium]MCP4979432.1 arylsulfatase regulator [Gammaproteobacteria bacterium]